jgi:hypothetical protein
MAIKKGETLSRERIIASRVADIPFTSFTGRVRLVPPIVRIISASQGGICSASTAITNVDAACASGNLPCGLQSSQISTSAEYPEFRTSPLSIHEHPPSQRALYRTGLYRHNRWLLDFSQTALDTEPDFLEGIDEWWERVRERFDADRFEIVQSVFWELQTRYGIWYWDLKPGNIDFADGVS